MVDLYNTIERPLITEKALGVNGQRQYVFIVNPAANKYQIKSAVEKLFTQTDGTPVTVQDVNTMTKRARPRRFRAFGKYTMGSKATVKKAIVTLVEGQEIQLFEGV